MTILYVFAAIVMLGVIVMFHEFGHYLVGRWTGMAILEFSVGFGPKIIGFERSGIRYSLRLIPLGGYCSFLGEDEKNEDPRAMRNQPVWKRFFTVLAGPVMNFALAFVAAVALIWGYGIAYPAPVVEQVTQDSPAYTAGLQAGDIVTQIDGTPISRDSEGTQELIRVIRGAKDGALLTITVDRSGEEVQLQITPAYVEEEDAYQVGILLGYLQEMPGFWNSVRYSGAYVLEIGRSMLTALKAMVTTGEGLQDTMGPVGIIGFVSQEVRQGFDMALMLVIIISLNLGIMNLIPFPGLDGGRLLFLIVEGVRRKPVDPNKEGWVHAIGLVLLLGLILVVTYRDILRLFTGG